MATAKRQQSNAMLYTTIIFVALFIAATVVAIVFYVEAEEKRAALATLQSQTDELATSSELKKMSALVGAKQPRKSRVGTMVNYLDQTVSLIVGGLPADTTAEVKVGGAEHKVKQSLNQLAQNYPDFQDDDPNTVGLVRTIEKLSDKLVNNIAAKKRA